jgi:nitrate reductase beta subunit
VYRFVKTWKLALPLHPEFGTVPMLFYVPPLSPVMAAAAEGGIENLTDALFHDIDAARVPVRFLASLLAAGHEAPVRYALRKQIAVRWHRRALTVGDVDSATADWMLRESDCTPQEAEAIYQMTTLASANERFVVPPGSREEAIAATEDPLEAKQAGGFGFLSGPREGK